MNADRERFSRSEMLLGREAMERLAAARVAVFGLGGVGGAVVEALARAGIGALDVIDHDTVSLTNLNRQLLATQETLGEQKTAAAKRRIHSIHPACVVTEHSLFYLPETAEALSFSDYDYVVDAIDTVTGKLSVIEEAVRAGVPVISAMGAGNKLDPTAFRVADLYETSVCPLARVMRRECKARGIQALKVVYSEETARTPQALCAPEEDALQEGTAAGGEALSKEGARRALPGSVSFVPPVMGFILAGEVIKDLAYPEKTSC